MLVSLVTPEPGLAGLVGYADRSGRGSVEGPIGWLEVPCLEVPSMSPTKEVFAGEGQTVGQS